MALFCSKYTISTSFKISGIRLYRKAGNNTLQKEFPTLIIKGKNSGTKVEPSRKLKVIGSTSPRYQYLPTNVDWTNVWPAAASFKPSVVPLPIRQGYIKNHTENNGIIPAAYANLELMKIPNFLHLTPKHIKKHCDLIKKFCTNWPSGLTDEAAIRKHYPIEVVTHDYVFSGNSIREPKARVVKLSLPLSELRLDSHARAKFLRLISFNSQCKYNDRTDMITFTVDRCPLRKQNYEYIIYVLTVLYGESNKTEQWENEQEERDWDYFCWEKCSSRASLYDLLTFIREKNMTPPPFLRNLPEHTTEEDLESTEQIKKYRDAMSRLFEEGENLETLNHYKDAVKNLFGLPVKT